MCVSVGEVSVNFDIVLDEDFVTFVLAEFSQQCSAEFYFVSIVLYLCVILLWMWVGWWGGGGI